MHLIQISATSEGLVDEIRCPVDEAVEVLDEDVLDEVEAVDPEDRLSHDEPAVDGLRPEGLVVGA
jgi:hypothetical protein